VPPPSRADQFEPLPPDRAALWGNFLSWPGRTYFPNVVGLQLEEIRTDYARIRLPYRDELQQPAGVVHGGAIATLIDTVVVPAVASPYDAVPRMLTLTMNVQYVGAVVGEDAVAEGWIVRRGRSTVFCRSEVMTDNGTLAATGELVYTVRPDQEGQ
jgi:uncharacterized protein (TIGR00369 family)